MNWKWKALIILMLLGAIWIRFAPAVVWYNEAKDWGDRIQASGWRCEQGYEIIMDWSWWSLRFTRIYPECIGE